MGSEMCIRDRFGPPPWKPPSLPDVNGLVLPELFKTHPSIVPGSWNWKITKKKFANMTIHNWLNIPINDSLFFLIESIHRNPSKK